MSNTIEATKELGLEKGFLQNKKIWLKPIPRGGKMITDPNHRGYFMWEGASKSFCLALDKRNELVTPFKTEAEQRFFSEILDLDLNVYKKKENFWHSFYVVITKDHKLMTEGVEFDLSDPMDNLRVRVLKQQREIAPSWDDRFGSMAYKFAFVDEDYEEKTSTIEMDVMEAIWTYWGEIKTSAKKMKEFLGIYHMEKKSLKVVPQDATKEFLSSEIKKIIDSDKETAYKIIKDEDSAIKLMILRAMVAGAITKEGVGTFSIVGDGEKYGYADFIGHLKFLKETTDPLYQKIEAQINTKK